MKKILSVVLSITAFSNLAYAQTLEKMNWFNEPENWKIENGTLTMDVTPKSDYWRISHYGFTVDDAPFYYAEYGENLKPKLRLQATIRLGLIRQE